MACAHDRIILSAKVSGVQDLVDVYRSLAQRSDYPLHLGLTEAGLGIKGIVASTAGLAILLQEGIGDTIRVSLTPKPGGDRADEVQRRPAGAPVAGLAQLQSRRSPRAPGAGAPRRAFFQEMAEEIQALPARHACRNGATLSGGETRCGWRSWGAW